MELSEKQIIELLETLNEHKMAKEIFVPLLKKMSLSDVRFVGGTGEEGIDIEYSELTQPENIKSWVGIQFKKGNLNIKTSGDSKSVVTILNQSELAFSKEITDITNRTTTNYISRYIVACTGKINAFARKKIETIRKKGESRRVDFWERDFLSESITTHWLNEFKEYFKDELANNSEEEYDDDDSINVLDAKYFIDNHYKLIEKCRKVLSTISSSYEKSIIVTLAQNSGNMQLPDLLMELEITEDALQFHMTSLMDNLKYIEADRDEDDVYVSISGNAQPLAELHETIAEELEQLNEFEEEKLESIFYELLP